MSNLYNVFKQVYHLGQCHSNDIMFEQFIEWWQRWENDPEFLEAVEDWYEKWLKDNPELKQKD